MSIKEFCDGGINPLIEGEEFLVNGSGFCFRGWLGFWLAFGFLVSALFGPVMQ